MKPPRIKWTDERLDDLSSNVARMDERLTNALYEVQRSMLSLQRTVIGALVVIIGIVASGYL
ncbi:MAG: hypothetical protein U0R26_12235 [Solirubrobacterales bacterium]